MANKMALEKKIDLLVDKVGGLASRIDRLETKFDGLETKMAVGFEESHRLMKLSLEGLGGLEETTVQRFDDMKDHHAKQFDLLQKFGVHVRRRVEQVEGPALRRRR